MIVPEYIKHALRMRAKSASNYNHYDYIVSQWCIKHNIDTEQYDISGGVESVVNPYESSCRVLEAIEKK